MSMAAEAFNDWPGTPLSREFAHQARRMRASRLRNVGRGLVADANLEPVAVTLVNCRRAGFRLAVFSPDPTWRAWA